MGDWTLYIDESGAFEKARDVVAVAAVHAPTSSTTSIDMQLRAALSEALRVDLWPPHAAKQRQSLLVASWAKGAGAHPPRLSDSIRAQLEARVALPEDPRDADETSLLFALTRQELKADAAAVRALQRGLAAGGRGPITDPELAPVQLYRALDLAVTTLASEPDWSHVLGVLAPTRLPNPAPLDRLDNMLRKRLPRWAWDTLANAWTRAWAAVHVIGIAHALTAALATETAPGAAMDLEPSRYEALLTEVLRISATDGARVEVQRRHIRRGVPMLRSDIEAMAASAGLTNADVAPPVAFERPNTHGAHVLADYVAHDAWASLVNKGSLPGLENAVRRRTGVRLAAIRALGEPEENPPLWLRALRGGR